MLNATQPFLRYKFVFSAALACLLYMHKILSFVAQSSPSSVPMGHTLWDGNITSLVSRVI